MVKETGRISIDEVVSAIVKSLAPDSTDGRLWQSGSGVSYALVSGGVNGLLLIIPVQGLGAAIPIIGTNLDALREDAENMDTMFLIEKNPGMLTPEMVRTSPLGLARAIGVIDRSLFNTSEANAFVHPEMIEKVLGARNAGYSLLSQAMGETVAYALTHPASTALH